jgi:hypothetical protein
VPGDDAFAFEHAQMVGEQAGGHPQLGAELTGRRVAENQRIEDSESDRVRQCRERAGTARDCSVDLGRCLNLHCLNLC